MDYKHNQIVLNDSNYATWKIQCKMALMKDGLWGFVNGMETIPDSNDVEATHKYHIKRDRALATIVLAVDPSLLYIFLEMNPKTHLMCGKGYRNSFKRSHGLIN